MNEYQKRFADHQKAERDNWEALERFARGLVHVLRDHKADSSASELERILFMIDSEKADLVNFVGARPPGEFLSFMESMIRRIPPE